MLSVTWKAQLYHHHGTERICANVLQVSLAVNSAAAEEGTFATLMQRFLVKSRGHKANLMEQAETVGHHISNLAVFLGEPKTSDPAAIFGSLEKFASIFDDAFVRIAKAQQSS